MTDQARSGPLAITLNTPYGETMSMQEAIVTSLKPAPRDATPGPHMQNGHRPASFTLPANLSMFGTDTEGQAARDRLIAESDAATQAGQRVQWFIPLAVPAVYRLASIFQAAEARGVDALFHCATTPKLSRDDRLFVIDFIKYRLIHNIPQNALQPRHRAYAYLSDALEEGAPETIKNAADALALTPAPGPVERKPLLLSDFADVGFNGVRAHAMRTLASTGGTSDAVTRSLPRVMLIGAYGGEHIGDLAILGGVLKRLHERNETRDAVLMTQRPAHTRHLVDMLDSPVHVKVCEYQPRLIDGALSSCDALVFAGGPLTDLPKQLVRHLYAASRARRRRIPFIVEGIGPSTMPRLASRVSATRLLDIADYISVRTSDCRNNALVQSRTITVGRDPAFDYLETRGDPLTKLAPGEADQVNALLAGSDDRPVIGVNTRPIHNHYTVTPDGTDSSDFTTKVMLTFEKRLADALTELTASTLEQPSAIQSKVAKPVFVFFPMNAVQFGQSDLESAYRIATHLGDEVDFRVWEADASLDAVVLLMRRLSTAITMRFHATIFALSQGLSPIGIDYRIGKRDKVAAVLADAGKEDQCTRIDQMTTAWIVDQLRSAIG